MQDTPVTAEGFTALRRLIEGESQYTSELNQHRMQKAFNAAERAMTSCTLLEDQRRALFLQNCERKTRVSTKSRVVGTAKVMSYQEIVEQESEQAEPITRTAVSAHRGMTARKHRVAVTDRAPEKRQVELRQAIRDINRSDMHNYCHVFEI